MSQEEKNIIIDVTEKEEAIYQPPGDLKDLKVTGEVSIINPSAQNRLWNIELTLKGLETVVGELASEMKIGELGAKSTWTKSYDVKNEEIQTKTLLKLTEIIDTYYEKGVEVNWALVKDHQMPVSFTISLENTCEAQINKIKLVKNLPPAFGNPIIDAPAQGEARFDANNRQIIWEGFNLVSGGVQSLVIRVGFKPDTVEPYNSGDIEVDYVVLGPPRSKLTGTPIALSDSMFAIDQGESLEEPGQWECTAEFENMSDFLVELKSVNVSQITETRKDVVMAENPNVIIAPGKSWSKDFKVKSGIVPKFANVHDFTIVPKLTSKVIGHIKYIAGVLPVLDIHVEKIIDPPAVSAYTKTPIQMAIVVTNTGSATINEVIIRDTIPIDHKPPELDQVIVAIGEEELRSGVIREIDPTDSNVDITHGLSVKIKDLSQVGGLQPQEQLVVRYPLTAWEPKPKEEYGCPVDVIANVSSPGPPTKLTLPNEKVEIKYVRRRIRAYKGETPGAEPGEYIIPIVFENKGEVLIENITLKDIIPPNFSLLDWNPKDFKPETSEIDKGTQLVWKIARAPPGEKIQFSYTIKGTGDYVREELEVIVG
ncbi:MAG: hypothetical protein EU536_02670 [Promethearchaeota archaeon]|nr:MAG: hypothetical protein EU536_02670 [Candidatus Lokiarchaeota archaeon]